MTRTGTLLVTTLLLSAVVGAAISQGGVTTVKVWHHAGDGGESQALKAAIARFNAQNKDVQAEVVTLPGGTYSDQVNAAALADSLPCLLDFDGPNAYNYAWSGKIIPIDKYIPASVKGDIIPSIIRQGTYNGKLYSLGQFDSGLSIFGNRELLTKAGVRIPKGIKDSWSFAEFNDVLKKLKTAGVAFPLDLKLNYGVGEWFTYAYSPILQSFGGDLIDRSTYQHAAGTINSPASVRALTWMQGLIKSGYVNPKPAGDSDFLDGKSALSYVGYWAYPDYVKAMGAKLVLLPVPRYGAKAVTGSGSWNWGISSNCKTPEATAKVLNFLLTPDEVLKMSDATGAVPSRKSAIAKSKLYAPNGPLALYVDQINSNVALVRPATPAYPAITTAFAEAVNNILAGADVKGELDKAAAKIDRNIEDNRGYPNK